MTELEQRLLKEIRLLRVFTAVSAGAAVVACLVLIGSGFWSKNNSFDVLSVHRLNILDSNGIVRMALFDKAQEPGPIFAGKPVLTKMGRFGGDRAGIMFYNDIGDEQGGLLFRGNAAGNGAVLSFDPFRQNDDVDLFFRQKDGVVREGMALSQHAALPLTTYAAMLDKARSMPDGKARDAQIAAIEKEGFIGQDRLFAGVDEHQRSSIVLDDARGNPRIVIRVTAAGSPVIQFLSANGHIQKQIAP